MNGERREKYSSDVGPTKIALANLHRELESPRIVLSLGWVS
jgi:hypothetical protein